MSPLRIWGRRLAIATGSLLLLWALAWLAVPPLLKSQAQSRLSALLGRSVTIGAVDFRPWSLELTVDDLAVGPAPGASQPTLRLARLHADADAASLWRRAPVLSALELDGLQLNVARTGEGRYDFDDIVARLTPAAPAAPEPPSEPARFALHNLQLRDAAAVFDDRPVGRVHRLEGLQLKLPFLSTLPSQVEITVEPHLAFRLNGAAFDSGAQATPFAPQRSGELKLEVTELDLAPYLGYLPEALPVRLQRGVISADLALRFVLPKEGDPALVLAGHAAARRIAVADRAGAPLLGWRELRLELKDVQALRRRLGFGALRVDGAELAVARGTDGRLNLTTLAAAPVAASAPPAAPAAAVASAPAAAASAPAAWQLRLDSLELADARVRWNDAATRPAAALQLDGLTLKAREIRWPLEGTLPLEFGATLRSQADAAPPAGSLSIEGRVGEHEAQATLRVADLALATLAPYTAQALTPQLDGKLALQGALEWSDAAAAPKLAVTLDTATLDGLRLSEGSGRAVRDAVALKQLQLADVRIDLQGRRVAVGRLALAQPQLELARDGAGQWNVQRWAAPAPAGATPAAAAAPAKAASAAPPWRLQLQELVLDGGRVRLADAFAAGRAAEPPLRVDADGLRLRAQGLAWPGERGQAPAKVQLAGRVGAPAAAREAATPPGSIDWNGRFAPEPLLADGRLRIERFPVQLFEPYFADRIPLSLLRAEASLKSDFALQAAPAGWSAKAGGDLRLADVRVHTRPEPGAGPASTDELLSWQSLAVDGIRFEMRPTMRPQLEIHEAALTDFFARLVVTEQGRFNLSGPAAPATAASAPAAAAPATVAAASAPASPASAAEPALDLSVGGVRLANGRVDFSDRFVRPNYSANLTELNGRLGAFRSGSREMATLELRGRAAGTALLDIRGALNPTADPLALDIQAKATDLELAPLSPYAGKYAGYAIERGKLSMEVAYKIAPDGKLEARNQVILNQLTFGDKVESPEATKLPVLLAVALLKDRHGVIDINLPISGSINDPQFSVFGIVLKIIGNLLVKALTAPFALLAGGGSDDLSLVEFRAGTAQFSEAGRAAIDKVAKALGERPALKMTVTGAADPVSEREAFQRAALETRLLAERRRELLRSGAPPAEVDALATLDAEARARVLKEVYRSTDLPNKPRNALGFARDIPGPEMETLLAARTAVNTDVMRELALQRGLAVRDALIAQGLPSERLFLAAPKLRASGEDDAAWTPRVQLTLGTN